MKSCEKLKLKLEVNQALSTNFARVQWGFWEHLSKASPASAGTVYTSLGKGKKKKTIKRGICMETGTGDGE